ncbi:regulator of microtubule dynamics protein 3-like [Acanthaster planci]|uniref:Regulator of microtubule dynamics protein 1 n=1 Tax=Acanthaster planci TaxID=133434 RepID=A0A8B7Z927_ACAPL|nr:regulator of microtubule dynamics protein 3-like [Acanthaster planci]
MFSNLHFKEILPALGVGIAVGVSGAVMSYRLRSQTTLTSVGARLDKLAEAIAGLQREWREVRETLKAQGGTLKRTNSGFISVHASSGDEDDDFFEEAYEGFTTPPEALLYKDAEESVEFEGETNLELVAFLREIDKLFLGTDEEQETALSRLLARRLQYTHNVHFMWRLAKAHLLASDVATKNGDDTSKKKLIFEGKDYAFTAISIDETNADAHKWYSLLIGLATDYVSNQEKIKLGYDFKEHMLKALELRPGDPYLYNYYGRYIYEIATMSWILRKAAAAIYGEPPSGTIDEALENFLKAEELQPEFFSTNALYVGKCYLQKRDTKNAVEWFQKAIRIPGSSADELKSKEEAQLYLRKYT